MEILKSGSAAVQVFEVQTLKNSFTHILAVVLVTKRKKAVSWGFYPVEFALYGNMFIAAFELEQSIDISEKWNSGIQPLGNDLL